MKLIIWLFMIGLFACNDANWFEKNQYAKYYTKKANIEIETEIGEHYKYSRTAFNDMVDLHPEFFLEVPIHPDQSYYEENNDPDFEDEFGQDTYYVLYAYFLKQKNGVEKFSIQRQQLINIFTKINSLFANLKRGGSYFSHQKCRILGYVEYAIYLIKSTSSEKNDFNVQKALYLQSLKQLTESECNLDPYSTENEKRGRIKFLNSIVDELDSMITDYDFLIQAKEFHSNNYNFK